MARNSISDAEAIKKLATFVGVVPGYRDVFGAPLAEDHFESIIKRHDVIDWLSFLSRLSTLLAPPHHLNTERHRAAFLGIVPGPLQAKIQEWVQKNLPHKNGLPFIERQIATLQQLVILHAPEKGGRGFESPQDFDDLTIALLATWDRLQFFDEPQDVDELQVAIVQSFLQSQIEFAPILASRAFSMFQVGESKTSHSVEELQSAFRTATGVHLRDYLLGGLVSFVVESTKGPGEIANNWTPCASNLSNSVQKGAEFVRAYCAVRCAKLDRIRTEIGRIDINTQKPIHEYSLVGLSRFPMIDISGKGCFSLSLKRMGDSLLHGIRHAIKTGVDNRQGSLLGDGKLGKLLGQAEEDYILKLLEDAFADRLIRIPRSNVHRSADFLLLYPDAVVVGEIKCRYVRSLTRLGPRTISERKQELVEMGILDATAQIIQTTTLLRSGKLNDLLGREYDWTKTTVIPLVVTAQNMPLFWLFGDSLREATSSLRDLPMQAWITETRFLTVADVERLVDLSRSENIASVLCTWSRDSATKDTQLSHHLHVTNTLLRADFMKRRVATLFQYLAAHCGLDSSVLRLDSEGQE